MGRGLAETDIGSGLEQALEYFEGQPYTGARIVVLVSDGAGEIGLTARLRIAHLMRGCGCRCTGSTSGRRTDPSSSTRTIPRGGATGATGADAGTVEMTPERALHDFFSRMGASYRAYTAESPEGLEQAIAPT